MKKDNVYVHQIVKEKNVEITAAAAHVVSVSKDISVMNKDNVKSAFQTVKEEYAVMMDVVGSVSQDVLLLKNALMGNVNQLQDVET
jgi:prophage DNA circulation protein